MDPSRRKSPVSLAYAAGWLLVVVALAIGIGCWRSYENDQDRLRTVAVEVAGSLTSPSERVLTLLHWVYGHGGTAKNRAFFGLRYLGATAAQVLHGGGDCADKSRLLTSLLREVGIPASMAMCFDARSGLPVHTVVVAETGQASYMLVDPAFDLFFPKPDGLGYHGLLDLRKDPSIVARRVRELQSQLPPGTRSLPYYLRASASYETASTINWDRNAVLRWLHDRLWSVIGNRIYRLRRPLVLEEPKLLLASMGLLFGALTAFVLVLLTWKRGPAGVVAPTGRQAIGGLSETAVDLRA